MYIHLFVLVDTPANSSLRMYSLLYLPLFVIVDTPRVIYLSVYQLNMVVHG